MAYWTDEECQLLSQLYQKVPAKTLVDKFCRSITAIMAKAEKMGLQKYKRFPVYNNIFDALTIRINKNSNIFGEDGKYSTECWQWIGTIDTKGYGEYTVQGKQTKAHRLVYENYTGQKIDSKLCIDHLCRNRACVNPEHMEIVTLGENIIRGNSIQARNKRKDKCKNGHLFDEKNTYIRPDGTGRSCYECILIRGRNRKSEKLGSKRFIRK